MNFTFSFLSLELLKSLRLMNPHRHLVFLDDELPHLPHLYLCSLHDLLLFARKKYPHR